ncbi:hypothetical protein [Candidatus Finniella inopinata]|uniref:Uncharacterized protein n=1 Tax=Candidatus Finniella inopinata TaxID=1696036 RepID=A0A4Q7DK91_9PROT|nr:hypothetical protein [Candidatus Finniella inopinata]RZI46484.1 hypothetical protein EQU50_02550 [Candidatus Finniella inopinata]
MMRIFYVITFSTLLMTNLASSLTATEDDFSFKQARARKIEMDQSKEKVCVGFKKAKLNRNPIDYEFLNFSNYHVNWQRFFKVQNRR